MIKYRFHIYGYRKVRPRPGVQDIQRIELGYGYARILTARAGIISSAQQIREQRITHELFIDNVDVWQAVRIGDELEWRGRLFVVRFRADEGKPTSPKVRIEVEETTSEGVTL